MMRAAAGPQKLGTAAKSIQSGTVTLIVVLCNLVRVTSQERWGAIFPSEEVDSDGKS